MHKPIQLKDLSFFFPHKICFEGFSTTVYPGDHIAIIGRNGSGKSSLLNMLQGKVNPSDGAMIVPEDMVIAYVPQMIETDNRRSGGERFNQALTKALNQNPHVLLLDEPTNHLDRDNRKSLLRMLRFFHSTLIIVSHDVELLRNNVDIFWHIDHGQIRVFSGQYDDYQKDIQQKRQAIEQELAHLAREKKHTHHTLMQEQERAAKSRAKGEKSIDQRKWPTVVSKEKMRRASETTGRKKSQIQDKKIKLDEQLAHLRLPEIILPKFTLNAADINERTLLTIRDGAIGYDEHILIDGINFYLNSHDRIALHGKNGSGKTTFIKAILNDPQLFKKGEWLLPKRQDIGYLDQHYQNVDSHLSVYEVIEKLWPHKTHAEIRSHLNDFLFRKNEAVNAWVETLSGGEKVRLSLAQIAAQTPRLLILDEITNNIDLETRDHVIQVLQQFPCAMLVISHDENFLEQINITDHYEIHHTQIKRLLEK